MARFDLYRTPGKNRQGVPYLVEVQSNVISGLATRLVIPLRPLTGMPVASMPRDLFPTIAVNGEQFYLDTPQMGAIPLAELRERAGSAHAYQFEIQTALDRVFGAY